MTSGRGSVETAVEAIKMGACKNLTKPVALSELKLVNDKAAGIERLASAPDCYNVTADRDRVLPSWPEFATREGPYVVTPYRVRRHRSALPTYVICRTYRNGKQVDTAKVRGAMAISITVPVFLALVAIPAA